MDFDLSFGNTTQLCVEFLASFQNPDSSSRIMELNILKNKNKFSPIFAPKMLSNEYEI